MAGTIERLKDFAAGHPWIMGGIVLVVGGGAVYFLFSGGSSTGSASNQAALGAAAAAAGQPTAAEIQAQAQLQGQQITAQTQLAGLQLQTQAQSQQYALAAQTSQQQTQAQVDIAQMQAQTQQQIAALQAGVQNTANTNQTNVQLASVSAQDFLVANQSFQSAYNAWINQQQNANDIQGMIAMAKGTPVQLNISGQQPTAPALSGASGGVAQPGIPLAAPASTPATSVNPASIKGASTVPTLNQMIYGSRVA